MKKIIIIAITIVCGVAFSESFAKKPKKTISENQEQFEAKMYHNPNQAKLDSLKREIERRDSLRAELVVLLEEQKPSRPYISMENLELPCIEEARSTENYYGAWAVSDGKPNQSIAVQEAMRRAQLELAIQIGEKEVVLDDVEIVCRTISRDTRGNFIAYVAIRKPKNK